VDFFSRQQSVLNENDPLKVVAIQINGKTPLENQCHDLDKEEVPIAEEDHRVNNNAFLPPS